VVAHVLLLMIGHHRKQWHGVRASKSIESLLRRLPVHSVGVEALTAGVPL